MIKFLSGDVSNDNKYKLKLNLDNNNNNAGNRLFNSIDSNIKNSFNKRNEKKNNLYGDKLCKTSFSESYILYNDVNHKMEKLVNEYTYKKDEE